MGGLPVTLVGTPVKVGDRMPDVALVGNDLKDVLLRSYEGKVLVLSAVASLDTEVCNLETRRFNAEAARLGEDVRILTVSMDLPFAQRRWCGAAGVDRVVTLSDHKHAAFGEGFGVLMKDHRLLARAVFVVDRDGTVRYIQIVEEVGKEPNYEPVLAEVRRLAGDDRRRPEEPRADTTTDRGERQPTWWKCAECGYMLQADVPPETCPSCHRRCEFRDVSCYTPDCGMRGPDSRLLGGR